MVRNIFNFYLDSITNSLASHSDPVDIRLYISNTQLLMINEAVYRILKSVPSEA
jgi:hypothetical protein